MQHELLGGGVSGYRMSQMCRETCEDHVLLVLNGKPLPVTSSINNPSPVRGRAWKRIMVEASNISSVSHDSQ